MCTMPRVLLFVTVAVLALAAPGCGERRSEAPAAAVAEAEASAPLPGAEGDGHVHGAAAEGAGHDEHGHGEGEAELSDLDRPVAELLAARCEHAIPTHTCAECRYEVGVAKAGDELFDPAQGGRLATMRAGARRLAGEHALNGEVRLNEEKAVYSSPLVPGVVRSIAVDLGSRAAAGQVLFEVESSELREAKGEALRAAAALALARATAERERDLFARGVCPRRDLDEAEAALAQAEAERSAVVGRLLAYGLSQEAVDGLAASDLGARSGLMPVRAPFAGEVLERSLSLGAQVSPGDKLLLFADTATVWVIATVYEREVAAVLAARGSGEVDAEITVAAYPGTVFPGRIDRVAGTLDEATRTARVRIVVANPGRLLRAGMFARVTILLAGGGGTGGHGGGIALPEEAILEDEGRAFVFVRAEGPYFVRRPVTVGRTFAGWAEVTGIAAGDEVVSRGAFLLKSDVLRSKMGAGCAD